MLIRQGSWEEINDFPNFDLIRCDSNAVVMVFEFDFLLEGYFIPSDNTYEAISARAEIAIRAYARGLNDGAAKAAAHA